MLAVTELAKYIGEEPYALLPTEIGAGNTIIPMYVAAMMNRITVDGDACGRAKPELSISTPYVRGIPATPLCIVSPYGDIMILKKSVDDNRAEDICRQISIISGGTCGMARCPTKWKIIREAIVPNSIMRCIEIGRTIREARETRRNPVEAFIQAAKGINIFEGKVMKWYRKKEGAFMWGTISIKGTDEYVGQTLEIWFKNEFLVSWKDGKPYVTCPDLICVLDGKTSRGLSNWTEHLGTYVGKRVAIVGVRSARIWRSKRGIQIFGPRHFGYDMKYVPVEEILKS